MSAPRPPDGGGDPDRPAVGRLGALLRGVTAEHGVCLAAGAGTALGVLAAASVLALGWLYAAPASVERWFMAVVLGFAGSGAWGAFRVARAAWRALPSPAGNGLGPRVTRIGLSLGLFVAFAVAVVAGDVLAKDAWQRASERWPLARGRILEVSVAKGRRREFLHLVYAYEAQAQRFESRRHAFDGLDGPPHELAARLHKGDLVVVRYAPERPEVSTIQGWTPLQDATFLLKLLGFAAGLGVVGGALLIADRSRVDLP